MGGIGKGLNEQINAMALNRSDIFELKGLEHHARCKKCDKRILALADELQDVLPYAG